MTEEEIRETLRLIRELCSAPKPERDLDKLTREVEALRKAGPLSELSRFDVWIGSVLHAAVRHGWLDAARLLLDAGADIDAAADTGGMGLEETPLHLASRLGDGWMVTLLVDRGAVVTYDDLAAAVRSTADNAAAVASKLTIEDNNYARPDNRVVRAAAGNPNPRVLDVVVAATRRVDPVKDAGLPALLAAARIKSAPNVKVLLDAGTSPNAGPDGQDGAGEGSRALIAACAAGAPDVVRLLLDRGASPAPVGGWSPLDAALTGREEKPRPAAAASAVSAAYGWGGSVSPTYHGDPAPAYGGDPAGAGAAQEPAAAALAYAHPGRDVPALAGVLRRLAEAGADLNAPPETGEHDAPLLRAVADGRGDSVLALLAAGASPDVATSRHETAAHRAAAAGHDEAGENLAMLRRVLSGGPDLTLYDAEGRTALAVAAERGWPQAAAALLEAGADISWGHASPAVLAAAAGSLAVVQELDKRAYADEHLPLVKMFAKAKGWYGDRSLFCWIWPRMAEAEKRSALAERAREPDQAEYVAKETIGGLCDWAESTLDPSREAPQGEPTLDELFRDVALVLEHAGSDDALHRARNELALHVVAWARKGLAALIEAMDRAGLRCVEDGRNGWPSIAVAAATCPICYGGLGLPTLTHEQVEEARARVLAVLVRWGDELDDPRARRRQRRLVARCMTEEVAAGRFGNVRQLLRAGADPHALGRKDARSAVGAAARLSARREAESLLGELLAALRDGVTLDKLLWQAAVRGDAWALAAILRAGADPTRTNPEGSTTLAGALLAGDLDTVAVVLGSAGDTEALCKEQFALVVRLHSKRAEQKGQDADAVKALADDLLARLQDNEQRGRARAKEMRDEIQARAAAPAADDDDDDEFDDDEFDMLAAPARRARRRREAQERRQRAALTVNPLALALSPDPHAAAAAAAAAAGGGGGGAAGAAGGADEDDEEGRARRPAGKRRRQG